VADLATGTRVAGPRPQRRAGGARAPRRQRAPRLRRNLTAHGFLVGAVLCFAFFSWYPMCREIVMSFQETQLGVTSWAGWTTTTASSTTRRSGRPGGTRWSSRSWP
jgi:multiple sugar transport system permease protein